MSKIYILIILIFTIMSCNNENKNLVIGISKGSGSQSYQNYIDWLKKVNPTIQIIDFVDMPFDSINLWLSKCDGLILSGGPDVHPARFGKNEDTARCSIDLGRDTTEFKLINLALKNKMPILGICRGLQIMNVAQGGNLIIDIPEDIGDKVIHQYKEDGKGDAEHNLNIVESSYLYKILGTTAGKVNSNHHQAIEILGSELLVSARTEDGMIEGIEWNNKKDKSWLVAVQWHPERMPFDSPFSGNIAKEFIENVEIYAKESKK